MPLSLISPELLKRFEEVKLLRTKVRAAERAAGRVDAPARPAPPTNTLGAPKSSRPAPRSISLQQAGS